MKWVHRLLNIDKRRRTATCQKCGSVKVYPKSRGRWECATEGKLSAHIHWLKVKGQRGQRLDTQCAICGATDKLCWDHNHATGKFRGTLCNTCNLGIGLLKDSPYLLERAIEYVTH